MRQSRELHEAIQTGEWRWSPALALHRALSRFDTPRVVACVALTPYSDRPLDVGCGGAAFLRAARGRYRAGWGLDQVTSVLQSARRKGSLGDLPVAFVSGSAEALPCATGTLDTVVSISVLPFVFDPYRMLAEAHRVLRPGGTLVLETTNLAYLPHRLGLLCGRLPRTSVSAIGWDGGTLHYFTKPALAELLRDSGFDPVAWSGSGVFARWRAWWPSLLCGDLIVRAVRREEGRGPA